MLAKIRTNLYPIITYAICLMGCAYQTYKISGLYFRYETTTNVRYDTNYGTEWDTAFTVCVPKIMLIKREVWSVGANDTSDDRKIINEFNRMSIGQQFDAIDVTR